MAGKLSLVLPSPADRIDQAHELLATGHGNLETRKILAKRWGCSTGTAAQAVTEAFAEWRELSEAFDADDMRNRLQAMLDRAYRGALKDGDHKGCAAVARVMARVAGLDAPQRVAHLHAHVDARELGSVRERYGLPETTETQPVETTEPATVPRPTRK